MSGDRIKEIQEQIAELKRRWPAHSAPPAYFQQLDELEEELDKELRKAERGKTRAQEDGNGGL